VVTLYSNDAPLTPRERVRIVRALEGADFGVRVSRSTKTQIKPPTPPHRWGWCKICPGQARPTAEQQPDAARMKALGIPARSARNTVLMELAAELPAVVLSKLLGLSPSAATRWTEYAGAPAAAYAADLARRANRGRQ
jgi:hypothetical protein